MKQRTRNDVSFESVVDVHHTHNHTNDLATCNCSPIEDASLTRDIRLTCNEVRPATLVRIAYLLNYHRHHRHHANLQASQGLSSAVGLHSNANERNVYSVKNQQSKN